jgi:ABC-type antimicrobial peptide transport system permease subunit
VLGGAGIVAGTGVAVGIIVAVAGASLLSSFLFGITPRDPLTLAVTAVAIGLTTLLASYVPARRASSADPAVVLRAE